MFAALTLIMSGITATSVAVENQSSRSVRLVEQQVPSHYSVRPLSVIAAGSFDRISSASAKIILPHAQAATGVITLRYVDQQGSGCLFKTTVLSHTSAWSKLKPLAIPINEGKCMALTGRTIGDFVFVIR